MTDNLDFSPEKITEMASWPFFQGWTAASCGKCHAKVNVPIGAGFFCPCGECNILSWNYHQFPHSHPDHGPSHDVIVKAIKVRKKPKLPALVRLWMDSDIGNGS